MMPLFISIRFLDVIDIFLVAYLMYKVYNLIKGTVAINIFVGILSIYLMGLLMKALNMQLLGGVLGEFTGVGVIVIIIVFQQEVRRFLLLVGMQYFTKRTFSFEHLFSLHKKTIPNFYIKFIVKACHRMSVTKTGALIVMARKTDLNSFIESGDLINADISPRLMESIFFKNSPLHDGGMIIIGDRIEAARCILPVSENTFIPAHLGLRHRAALGISEATDAFVIIVSEETGAISYAQFGEITTKVKSIELKEVLEKEF